MTMPPPAHFEPEPEDNDDDAMEMAAPPDFPETESLERVQPAPPPPQVAAPPPWTPEVAHIPVPLWTWQARFPSTEALQVQTFTPEVATCLRQIRAEVQGLQSVLTGFQKGTLPFEEYRDNVASSVAAVAGLMAQ